MSEDAFIPAHLKRVLKTYVNVLRDGHCGFRAISISLGRSEDDWAWVRAEMLKDLNLRSDFYKALLDDMISMSFDEVRTRLDTTLKSVAGKREFWLTMPGFIGIIANTFNRPVLFYSTQPKQERVCYPYFSEINNNPPITFLGHGDHFYSLDLDFSFKKFPIPRICPTWRRYKTKVDSANIAWADKFHDSNDLYPEKKKKTISKGATFGGTIPSDSD